MGWPGQWNILGELRGREELSTGGYPSAPAPLTYPPPSRPCRLAAEAQRGQGVAASRAAFLSASRGARWVRCPPGGLSWSRCGWGSRAG